MTCPFRATALPENDVLSEQGNAFPRATQATCASAAGPRVHVRPAHTAELAWPLECCDRGCMALGARVWHKHPRSLPTPRARNWALMDENARSSSLPGADARAVCPWRTRRRHAVPWETPRHTPFPVHVGTPTFFEHTHRRPVTRPFQPGAVRMPAGGHLSRVGAQLPSLSRSAAQVWMGGCGGDCSVAPRQC